MSKQLSCLFILFLALAVAPLCGAQQTAPSGPKPQLTVVTFDGNLEDLPQLQPADFELQVGKQKGPPVKLYRPEELPTVLAIVLQENQPQEFGAQFDALKEFILNQPPNTYVGVFYLSSQSIQPTLNPNFQNDLKKVAESLHAPKGTREAAPPSPYEQLAKLLNFMNQLPTARKEVLLLSEGSDAIAAQADAPPGQNTNLRRAVGVAQAAGIPVFVLYVSAIAPEVRLQEITSSATPLQGAYGRPTQQSTGQFEPNQSSSFSTPGGGASGSAYLDYLTNRTGAKVFSPGKFAPDIRPFLQEFQRLLKQQYVLEYAGDEPPKKIRLKRKVVGAKLLAPEQ